MKTVTSNQLTSKMLGRAVIDRKRKTESSILIEQRAISLEFKTPLSPALLYNYYISICQVSAYDLTNDVKVGKQLGYSARAVGDVRRKLQTGNWIHFHKFSHKHITYGMWYIGKDVVEAFRLNESPSIEVLKELGIVLDAEYEIAKELEGF